MNDGIRVVGLCGSLREKSYNLSALRAAGELMPGSMSLEIADISDIPFYNQDIEERDGFPGPVRKLRALIAQADGLLIASPEYNFSIPAVLKNAIDWASRPPEQPFQDKPVAIVSATIGLLGGARVQYDLRRVLVQLWAIVLPRPEVFIGMAASKFDPQGRLLDENARKFLTDQMAGFRDWIVRVKRK
jgi:chromate reductase